MIRKKGNGHGLTMAHLNCEFLISSDSNPPKGIERVVCKVFLHFSWFSSFSMELRSKNMLYKAVPDHLLQKEDV